MPRTKKSDTDKALDRFIGERAAGFRIEHGWSLEHLATRLQISAPHLKSLESGRYSFSAGLLCRIATALGRPVTSFLPEPLEPPEPQIPELFRTWQEIFDALRTREKIALIEFARKLAGTPESSMIRAWKRISRGKSWLISLEGIDGSALDEAGRRFVDRLRTADSPASEAEFAGYEFDSALWRFMIERFQQIGVGPYKAFERTLLFECERLFRQETRIRPWLMQDVTVVTPYFSLAPSVYQRMEGLEETTAIEAVERFRVEPDMVILVQSSAAVAAQKAVPHVPSAGQFYSPYAGEESFRQAGQFYAEAIRCLNDSGIHIATVEDNGDPAAVAEAMFQAFMKAYHASRITN